MIEAIKQIDNWQTRPAAETLAILQASDVTFRPVQLDELLFLLNNRGMLSHLYRPADGGVKWTGTIVTMMNAVEANGDAETVASMRVFFSHITNSRNKTFNLTMPDFAGPFRVMASQFAGIEGMPTAEDFAAIAALGGSWKFADATEQNVAAAIAKDAITMIWTAKKAVIEDGIHDGSITTLQGILDAIGGV